MNPAEVKSFRLFILFRRNSMIFKEKLDFQVLKLTDAFYEDYPTPPFTEILRKRQRAYDCLFLQADDDVLVCIPYRSHITHSNAFYFKKSVRSRKSRSGLDYSKAVIIHNVEYISKENAVIDQDEFIETVENIDRIRSEMSQFIEGYCSHISGKKVLHEKEFKRRYGYSPIKYFHRELNMVFPS